MKMKRFKNGTWGNKYFTVDTYFAEKAKEDFRKEFYLTPQCWSL
jgi:hypothetical protein